jgi:UDP-glucose:O-linked fucose beta-1,3-glucosyltransferase
MSRETARILAFSCECPSIDSPDDMIIGSKLKNPNFITFLVCSRRLSIPILHSAAFHQTQRRDYNPLYIQRITPISFHKLENLDPYKEYNDHLMPKSNQHVEL